MMLETHWTVFSGWFLCYLKSGSAALTDVLVSFGGQVSLRRKLKMIWFLYFLIGMVSHVYLAIYAGRVKVVPGVFTLGKIFPFLDLLIVLFIWPIVLPLTLVEIRQALKRGKKARGQADYMDVV